MTSRITYTPRAARSGRGPAIEPVTIVTRWPWPTWPQVVGAALAGAALYALVAVLT